MYGCISYVEVQQAYCVPGTRTRYLYLSYNSSNSMIHIIIRDTESVSHYMYLRRIPRLILIRGGRGGEGARVLLYE